MSQSRTHSFVESIANVVIGFAINLVANVMVLPLFGYHVTVAAAAGIGVIFTGISIVRSYVLRRVFNGFAANRKSCK